MDQNAGNIDAPSLNGANQLQPNPRVSIILPIYNACRSNPRFLEEALNSIAAQTVKDFELIIVNDGSTDESGDICRRFIADHGELSISYHDKENGGQSSARNLGARVASGSYFCFIDQDDRWKPDRLELILPLLNGDIDLVYTDSDRIDQNGDVIAHEIHRTLSCGTPHPKRSIEDILYKDIFVMPGLMAIKRSSFEAVGGFDERLSGYEDDDLFLRLFPDARTVYLSAATLEWRKYDENYSSSERMINSRNIYWRKLLDDYAPKGGDRRRRGKISFRFFRESLVQAVVQFENGDPLSVRSFQSAQVILQEIPIHERIFFQPFFLPNDRAALGFIHSSYRQYRKMRALLRPGDQPAEPAPATENARH